MNDRELDALLRSADVPGRSEGYWDRFPARVMAKAKWRQNSAESTLAARDCGTGWGASRLAGVAIGCALICVAVGFSLGLWRVRDSTAFERQQMAQLGKCFNELQTLFPNQLQAVLFDEKGAHITLAAEANMPKSQPLYLRICGPGGCLRAVTFSGQQLRFNGDYCEVLVNREGEVLLVGQDWTWSSLKNVAGSGLYRIEAKALGAS